MASSRDERDGVRPHDRRERSFFSVVVPVRNGARFLMSALESVARQTWEAWACVIVDDGSEDGSIEIASRWAAEQRRPARVLTHGGRAAKGVAESRNLGVRASTAPWIAFLDQDDVWKPDKLARQAAFIDQHPHVAVVGCVPEVLFDGVEGWPAAQAWARMIASIDPERAADLRLRDFVAICPYCLSGVVARREALVAAGGFDRRLSRTSDWLMWARLASRGPLGLVREPLVIYRVHGENDILELAEDPLGAMHGMLEMHDYLAGCLARDQGRSREEAAGFIRRLFLETGETWHRAAAGASGGGKLEGSDSVER